MHREEEMVKRIAELMQKHNVTAQKLTSTLGISRTAVSEWKAGRTEPSVDHVRKIAAFFNVSTDYIINGTEKECVVLSEKHLDREMDTSMYSVYKMLDEDHREKVHDFFYMCLTDIANKIGEQEKIISTNDSDVDSVADFEARFNSGEFGEFDPNS